MKTIKQHAELRRQSKCHERELPYLNALIAEETLKDVLELIDELFNDMQEHNICYSTEQILRELKERIKGK